MCDCHCYGPEVTQYPQEIVEAWVAHALLVANTAPANDVED